MLNPIGGNRRIDNPIGEVSARRERTRKGKNSITDNRGGVVVDISSTSKGESGDLEAKIERIKRQLKEGKYPLDRNRLAEKILEFFTDGRG